MSRHYANDSGFLDQQESRLRGTHPQKRVYKYADYLQWMNKVLEEGGEGGRDITDAEWDDAANRFQISPDKLALMKSYVRGEAKSSPKEFNNFLNSLERRYYIKDGVLYADDSGQKFDDDFYGKTGYQGNNSQDLISRYNADVDKWRNEAKITYEKGSDGKYRYYGQGSFDGQDRRVDITQSDWFVNDTDRQRAAQQDAYRQEVDKAVEDMHYSEEDLKGLLDITAPVDYYHLKNKRDSEGMANYRRDATNRLLKKLEEYRSNEEGFNFNNNVLADALTLYLRKNTKTLPWLDMSQLKVSNLYKRNPQYSTGGDWGLLVSAKEGASLKQIDKYAGGNKIPEDIPLFREIYVPQEEEGLFNENKKYINDTYHKYHVASDYTVDGSDDVYLFVNPKQEDKVYKVYLGTANNELLTYVGGIPVPGDIDDYSINKVWRSFHDQNPNLSNYSQFRKGKSAKRDKTQTTQTTQNKSDKQKSVKQTNHQGSEYRGLRASDYNSIPNKKGSEYRGLDDSDYYKNGGTLNMNKIKYYQEGGPVSADQSQVQGNGSQAQSIEDQVMQLVQAAMNGDEQANQAIQQIEQAAEQGDQKAAQIVQLIQQAIQQLRGQKAKQGAKLAYIKSLKSGCPAGTEAHFYKKGGTLCKECIAKASEGTRINYTHELGHIQPTWEKATHGVRPEAYITKPHPESAQPLPDGGVYVSPDDGLTKGPAPVVEIAPEDAVVKGPYMRKLGEPTPKYELYKRESVPASKGFPAYRKEGGMLSENQISFARSGKKVSSPKGKSGPTGNYTSQGPLGEDFTPDESFFGQNKLHYINNIPFYKYVTPEQSIMFVNPKTGKVFEGTEDGQLGQPMGRIQGPITDSSLGKLYRGFYNDQSTSRIIDRGAAAKGALTGATNGALLGGAAGSVVPGIGTLVGAGLGAGMGAIAGGASGLADGYTPTIYTRQHKKGGCLKRKLSCGGSKLKAEDGVKIEDVIKKNKRKFPNYDDDQCAGRKPVGKDSQGRDLYLNGDGVKVPKQK